MDWQRRLKSLIVDDTKRGKIKLKLLDKPDEYRTSLFDDNDNAVRAALIGLIEPAAGTGLESGVQLGDGHPLSKFVAVLKDSTLQEYKQRHIWLSD